MPSVSPERPPSSCIMPVNALQMKCIALISLCDLCVCVCWGGVFCDRFAASALSFFKSYKYTLPSSIKEVQCVLACTHREQLFLWRQTLPRLPKNPCLSITLDSYPPPFLLPPRPPPRHAHRSIAVYNVNTMQLLGDNAPLRTARTPAQRDKRSRRRPVFYPGPPEPRRPPAMRAHCPPPVHTLPLPTSRSSILLLRPNRRILFPGNFDPSMRVRRGRREKSAHPIEDNGGKIRCFPSTVQAIFPGFISKSSGVENSILKEKWRGGGESWMKKRGVYGLESNHLQKRQPSSVSCALIISTNADLVPKQPRS